ncbi:MAG: phage tail protein [Deltaproteobacteria bacterium]|nr:MAG: phage tail protein [Deltaproteobacteria bacterium]
MATQNLDPYGNYYFALELTVDGHKTEVAHFMECSGLKSTAEVFEIEEGGLNGRSHKRPGRSSWDNIVLRYATSASTFLLEWRDKYLQDKFDSRTKTSGAITLRNNAGEVVRRYEFMNAWPVSWEGPSFNSGSSELAVETLEIAHEGLTIS